MKPLLNIAIKLIQKPRSELLRGFDNVNAYPAQAEKILLETKELMKNYITLAAQKSHLNDPIFFSEDPTSAQGKSFFVIELINGEDNFRRGIPHFAVCLGFWEKEICEMAIVYDPFSNEMFTATRGDNAQLNQSRLRVRNTHNLQNLYLGLESKTTFSVSGSSSRQTGCPALMLAYVAAGRLDAFVGELTPLEMAIGSLLIQSAGGTLTESQKTFVAGHMDCVNFLLEPEALN